MADKYNILMMTMNEKGGLQVFFRKQQGGNFSSTLRVGDLGLNLTCNGIGMGIFVTREDNVSICNNSK